ncbi:hypothetical protein AC579_4775 [Pseudocercospora musae]|uniref:FAD dependent oxidoreductase domain-containing protein n=1 Tax=Pseudocercospora musae TaxID=113226 RepID=A0A139I7F4_9PEZI|nr:hypothetical protein AC579_4775 [Pseudocercospora musae]
MPHRTPQCQRPVAGATIPFWRTELHELDSFRSTEELPAACDIVVIGAGYAGVSTIHHLLNQHVPAPSLVLLEARQACSGASGRNGGHIKPDVYYNILKYTHKYGAEQAASFARFEARNVLAVNELVAKEKIDCDFVLTRALDVYLDDEHSNATKEAFDELAAIGVADLADIQYTQGETAEKISGVKGVRSCYSYTAGHIWSYKLVMELLSRAVKKGVNLQTHTPVTSVSESCDANGRWTVTTCRGYIKAHRVIFASNGYTAAIAPQFHEKIVPVRGVCSHIRPSDPSKSGKLSYSYSIRHSKAIYDYMIARLDGSIVFGGAKPTFWDDINQWYGNWDDSKLIEPAAEYFDGIMQRHFPGWEHSGAYTDKVWTGIMGWSSDFMPYVGAMPKKPGQYIIAGFSGHGMPLIHLSSKAMAEMVGLNKSFEETDLPPVFKPTTERLSSRKNEILGTLSKL